MYRYEETVGFHPIVQASFVAGIALSIWVQLRIVPSGSWAVFLGLAFFVLIVLAFGRLRIRIDADTLWVDFGYLGWPAQRIPLANIVGARVVSYRPIRQFGGWGIRAGRLDDQQTSVYTVRGTTGVLVELAEEQRISGWRTKRFLVGSLDPERMVAALGKGDAD